MKEIWKDIPNYEGLYQISNLGRVKSYDKLVNNRFKNVLRKGKILKLNINPKGYYTINLYKKGKKEIKTVHRIVANVFISKIEGKNIINHKDGNKLNNKINNLEWCNHKENTAHFIKTKKPDYSKYNFKRKSTIAIKNNKEYKFMSRSECAKFIGTDKGTINHILRGKGKTIKGFRIMKGDD